MSTAVGRLVERGSNRRDRGHANLLLTVIESVYTSRFVRVMMSSLRRRRGHANLLLTVIESVLNLWQKKKVSFWRRRVL